MYFTWKIIKAILQWMFHSCCLQKLFNSKEVLEATYSLNNFKKSSCSFSCTFHFESTIDLTLQSRFINWYFYSWEIIIAENCLPSALSKHGSWCLYFIHRVLCHFLRDNIEFKCSSSLFSTEAFAFAQEVVWFRSSDPISFFVVCGLHRHFSPWYRIPQGLGGRQKGSVWWIGMEFCATRIKKVQFISWAYFCLMSCEHKVLVFVRKLHHI